jgi:hypothetical protein
MSYGADATELLDVAINEFAPLFPLVAADRFGRLQRTELIQPTSSQNAADSADRYAEFGGICLPV